MCNEREQTHKIICLSYFVRCLLQSSLRRINSPIALVNVLLHIPHIVVFKSIFALIWRTLVLGLERFAVDSRARAKVLFRVCEEVMRACAGEEGSADLGVCERQLGVSGGGAGAHELLYDLDIRSYFSFSAGVWCGRKDVYACVFPEHLPSSFLCSAAMVGFT